MLEKWRLSKLVQHNQQACSNGRFHTYRISYHNIAGKSSSRRIEICPQSDWGCMGGGATDQCLEGNLHPVQLYAIEIMHFSNIQYHTCVDFTVYIIQILCTHFNCVITNISLHNKIFELAIYFKNIFTRVSLRSLWETFITDPLYLFICGFWAGDQIDFQS